MYPKQGPTHPLCPWGLLSSDGAIHAHPHSTSPLSNEPSQRIKHLQTDLTAQFITLCRCTSLNMWLNDQLTQVSIYHACSHWLPDEDVHMTAWPNTLYFLLPVLSQVRKVLSQQIFRTASLETKQKTNARFRLHNISTRITWPWGLTIDASNKLWPFYDGRRYQKLVSCMNFGRICLWHCRKLSFLTCSTWSLHQPRFHYWIIHLV